MAGSITVYFGTNRMPITDASGQKITDFNSEPGPIDGMAVQFGSAEVRITSTGAQLVPESLYVAPEQLVGPKQQRGSKDIFDKLRADMQNGGRPTLVVIHGFSNSFTDAIERAATILDFYAIEANVFSFTWPSRGSKGPVPLPYLDYVHDRGTARASGMAMARTMRILYDFIDALPAPDECRQPLHLICHSMGNYAFRHALQALMRLPSGEPRHYGQEANAIAPKTPGEEGPSTSFPSLTGLPTEEADPNRLRRTFEQIILAAADEDDDAFDDAKELKHLPRIGRGVTVYHTERDWILSTLSRFTKFNGPRLGTDGPDNMAAISDKVVAVDVSAAIDPSEDIESHQYYRIFPRVRDDIVAVLTGDRPDQVRNREATGAIRRYRISPPVRRRARARNSSR